MSQPQPRPKPPVADKSVGPAPPALRDLYQVVIECSGEAQQRELFERLRREGLKVRLLCL